VLQCQDAGPIGDNACASGFNACIAASVGNNSCNGSFDGCQASTIGHDSCFGSGQYLCYHATVGNYSCTSTTNYKCTYGTVGDCQLNDVTPSECFQPDVRVRRIGRTHLVGDDLYSSDAVGEWQGSDAIAGTTRRFVISIQNDGVVPDSFKLSSCTIANGGASYAYFHGWPATDVTNLLAIDGLLTTPTLAPGAIYRIRVVVNLPSSLNGTNAFGRIYATSTGNLGRIDAADWSVGDPALHCSLAP